MLADPTGVLDICRSKTDRAWALVKTVQAASSALLGSKVLGRQGLSEAELKSAAPTTKMKALLEVRPQPLSVIA